MQSTRLIAHKPLLMIAAGLLLWAAFAVGVNELAACASSHTRETKAWDGPEGYQDHIIPRKASMLMPSRLQLVTNWERSVWT